MMKDFLEKRAISKIALAQAANAQARELASKVHVQDIQ
jgi:hypothetical protein